MAKLNADTILAALDHFGQLALQEVQNATERVDAEFSLGGRMGSGYHNKTISDRTVEVYRARIDDMVAELDKLVGNAASEHVAELTTATDNLMTTIRTRRADRLERMTMYQPRRELRERYVAELSERLTSERNRVLRKVQHGVTSPDERLPFHRRYGRSIAVGALMYILGIVSAVTADHISGRLAPDCPAPAAQP